MYNNTTLTCRSNKKLLYSETHCIPYIQIRDIRIRPSTFDILNTQSESNNHIIFNLTIGQYTRSLGYPCRIST